MAIQNPDLYKWAPSQVVNAASKLIELKKNKSPWEVIEKIVEIWQSTCPKTYDSFIYTLDKTKRNSKITKGFRGVSIDSGSGGVEGTGGVLRHRLDIPVKVIYIIRKLYPDMPMDKEFYNKWARVFPKMKIEEKV